jgi:hypothetical protein
MGQGKTFFAGVGAALWMGCAPAAPPPIPQPSATVAPVPDTPEVPSKEDVSSGKDCVKAQSQCGGGACDVTVQNGCDAPVTCDATLVVRCRDKTDFQEAKGRKRGTVGAKSNDTLNVSAECNSGEVVHTEFGQLSCK